MLLIEYDWNLVLSSLSLIHSLLNRTSSMASVATVNGGRGVDEGKLEGGLEKEEEGLLYFLEVAGLEQVEIKSKIENI